MTVFPQVGVGAVIWRGSELVLVRRAKAPFAGAWSLPGGRQEPGETVRAALVREIAEETGLAVEITGLIDVVDAIFVGKGGALETHYTLIDYSARWVAGEARAGSDAAAVAWVGLADLGRIELWPETRRIVERSAALHGPGAWAAPSSC